MPEINPNEQNINRGNDPNAFGVHWGPRPNVQKRKPMPDLSDIPDDPVPRNTGGIDLKDIPDDPLRVERGVSKYMNLQEEPPHFDIDKTLDEIAQNHPELDGADNRNAVSDIFYPWVKPWLAIGYTAAAAVNRGVGGLAENLNLLSEYVENKTGWGRGEFFEKAAKQYEYNTEYWQKRAKQVGPTFLQELVGEAVGGAVPGVAEFMLNVPYSAAIGAAEAEAKGENELAGAMVSAAERGVLGYVFHAMAPLKNYLRAPVMGGVFGLQTAKEEGATREDIAKGVGTGILYSITSPGGMMGLNEIRRNLHKDAAKREAAMTTAILQMYELQELKRESKVEAAKPTEAKAEVAKPAETPKTVEEETNDLLNAVSAKLTEEINKPAEAEAPEPTEAEAVRPVELLDSVNPTGNVLADYSPQERATMKLGDNITTLDKTMGESPNKEITIYRGGPKEQTEIVPGDFITTNKQLAKDYAGTGVVIEKKVKLSDILDDKTEPLGEEYIYRPAEAEVAKPAEAVKQEIIEEVKPVITEEVRPEEAGAPKPAEEARATEEPLTEPTLMYKDIKPDVEEWKAAEGSLRGQKQYLMSKIEEALKEAPEKEGESAYDIVRIEVPGDGTFATANTKSSLKTLLKVVKENFPSTEKTTKGKLVKPSTKPTGKRITGEEVFYYNEFQPRNQGIVVDKKTDPQTAKNFYLEDGFYTDGSYIIKTEKPKDIVYNQREVGKTGKEMFEGAFEDAQIVGETYDGVERIPVKAHVIGKSGRQSFFDAKYVDAILTKYPNAKVKIGIDENMLAFYDGGKPVGLVMGLYDAKLSPWLIDRTREILKGRGFADEQIERIIKEGLPKEEGFGGGGTAAFAPQKGFRRKPGGKPAKETEITRRSDIVRFLQEKLDIPIRTGRFRAGKGILGIFKIRQEVIRTRFANDIETIAHEVGHALHKFLWGHKKLKLEEEPLLEFYDELIPIATPTSKGEVTLMEGFAEFVRRYITNEAEARKVAPRFYEHFDRLLNERVPEVKEIFLEAREQYNKFMEQPFLQRVLSQVSVGKRNDRPTTLKDLYTATIDDLYPLRKAVVQMMKGEELPTSKDPYKLARLMRGVHGKAAAFLRKRPFKFGTYEEVGKSLHDILNPIENKLDEFRAYILSKRTLELLEREIPTGIIKEDAEKVVLQYDNEFRQAFEDLKEYQDHVLNYLKDSGILSEEAYTQIRELNRDYVPLYRVFDENGLLKPGFGKEMQAWNPIRRIKGSERDIIDPLESIVKNTYLYINLAEKNAVGKALVELAEKKEGLGKWVERIPIPLQKISVKEAELLSILEKFGKWTETTKYHEVSKEVGEKITMVGKEGEGKLPAEKVEDMAREALRARGFSEGETEQIINRLKNAKNDTERTKIIEKTIEKVAVMETVKEFGLELPTGVVEIFRPSAFVPRDNVITVWREGRRELYEVQEDIARVFKALDQESTNMVLQIMSVPAKWLRIGATTTPEFVVRNIERDSISAFIYSEYGFLPVVDTVRGVFHMLKKDDLYWEWRKAGGEHSMLVSLDRQYLQEDLGDVIQKYPLRRVIKHPIEAIRILAELSEAGTRIGEFEKGVKAEKKKGLTRKQAAQAAAYSSREVTLDFAKKGAKTKAVNMLIAFFQAQLNGTDRMIRAFKDNPVRTTMRTLTAITLPSVLLTVANHDDPRWEHIPQWQKDLFFIYLPDDLEAMPIMIPKPFELGILFGTIPERITEYILTKDPHAFDDVILSIGRGAAPGVIPTAMLPFIENWANKSMFLDRPIVPRSMQDLLPEYQYGPYTTETAKLLGKELGKLPVVPDMMNVSPAMIENLVRGWTGGLGKYALNLMDIALEKSGIVEEKEYEEPTKTLADIPFVKAFFIRYPTTSAETIQRFYDRYEKTDRIVKTAKWLIKNENDYDTALGLLMEGNVERLSGYREALTNMSKVISKVHVDPEMTGDEKREFIDILCLQMMEIAKQGNEMFDELEKMDKEAK